MNKTIKVIGKVASVLLVVMLGTFASGQTQQRKPQPPGTLTASQVVAKASKTVAGARSLTAKFTVTAQGHTTTGTLKAAGKKFAIETPGSSSWYNGSSLYTYNASTQETTLTAPTPAELSETNPLLYVYGSPEAYTANFIKGAPKGKFVVALTPKNAKSGVKRVTVTLSSSTFLPEKIIVNGAGNAISTCIINSLNLNSTHPASAFEYPEGRYAGAEIVDLR